MVLTKSTENVQGEIYEELIAGNVLDIGPFPATYLCRGWPGKFL